MLGRTVNGRMGRDHAENIRPVRSPSQNREVIARVHDPHDLVIGGAGGEQMDMEARINLADLLVALILRKSE